MDVDREAGVFRLDPEEMEALKFNPTADTVPFDEVDTLHARIRQGIDIVNDWNPWDEPTQAKRNQALEERARRIRILSTMENQMMPIAQETMVEEVEQFLRDDPED